MGKDLDLLVTNNMFILNTLTIEPILKSSKDFIPFMDKLQSEVPLDSPPIDMLSMIKPYLYKPDFYLDKSISDFLTLDKRKELINSYIAKSNIDISKLFDWYMDSITKIIKYLLINNGSTDTIEISDTIGKSYVKVTTTTDDSEDSSDDSSSSDSKYIPLIKYEDKYIAYYNNYSVALSDEDGLDSNSEPSADTTLTKENMVDILAYALNIKIQGFKEGKITYTDNSNLLIKSRPFYHPPYGLQAGFNFNKSLVDLTKEAMDSNKLLSTATMSYYVYLYLHLSGIYFYKCFLSYPDLNILEVDDVSLPYVNTNFINTPLSETLDEVDNTINVEIDLEKQNM